MRCLTFVMVIGGFGFFGCDAGRGDGPGAPRAVPGNRADAPLTAAALEGTWTGDSLCQVPGSPCKDEKAVYRILGPTKAGKVSDDGGKVVNGKVVSMGVLEFDYDARQQTLTCEYPQGVWRFTVKGDD